jgi:soluble lytic murein transglycosylase
MAARSAVALVMLALAGCAHEPAPRMPTAAPSAPAPAAGQNLAHTLALVAEGRESAARASLGALLASDRTLEGYYLNALAALDHRAGHAEDGAAHDQRLLARHPASVWVPLALAREGARARARGEPAAEAFVERSLAHPLADAESRALALLVRAEGQSSGSPAAAYRTLHQVRRLGGPAATLAGTRAAALERAHAELLRDVSLQLEEAAVLQSEGRLDAAVDRLTEVAESTPGTRQGEVLRALAHTLRLAERFDEAIAVLRRAVALDSAPDNPARLQLAYRLWSQDRDAEARAIFTDLLREFPRHPSRDTLRYALGRIAEAHDDLPTALVRYREAAAGNDAVVALDARWRLGWAPYRAGDLATAADAFAAIARQHDADREPARYWEGRIRERQQQREAAVAAYEEVLRTAPEGYYGGRAEERLGRTLPLPPPARARTGEPPAALTDHDYHWTRRTALLAQGLDALAAREVAAWSRGLRGDDAGEPFLLSVYSSVGAHARARALAARLARSGRITVQENLAYDYPLAYWPHVQRAAVSERVDPHFVVAVMRQESLFDPEAVSPVGARGLMQLMPGTAARLASGPLDLRALADPATNIALGTRELGRLLVRYGGDVAKTAAAYNAGGAAVDKWLARDPGLEPDVFVETIGYRETRKYVKAVLANLRRYQRLYSREAAASERSRAARIARAADRYGTLHVSRLAPDTTRREVESCAN